MAMTEPTSAIMRSSGSRLVAGLAGSVLMAAALLKLAGANVSAFAQYGWWLSPNVQIAAIGWELILGACLILGVHRSVTWLLAMLTFALFAGVSAYLGVIGQASCGCFGAIEASPWAAFAVDVALLILLTIFRPRFTRADLGRESRTAGKWALGLIVVLATLTAVGVAYYGSPAAALAHLRGDTLTVDRTHLDFGHGKAGDVLTQPVLVTNWTGEPLRIVGGTSDCSCVTTNDLPITLSAGEAKALTINYKVPRTDQAGMTSRTAVLFTDSPKQPTLTLTLSVSVD